MRIRWLVWATVVSFAVGSGGRAMDTVRTVKNALPGQITAMSPVTVELEQGAAHTTKEIPVNEIQTIYYTGEPPDLKAAKMHVLAGRYAEALTAIERIKSENSRPEVQQDIEFYRALCAAKIALAGGGKIAEAGRLMKAFADANNKSYHYFEASEVVGDLLVAVRQYAAAANYYGRLDKAPWPDYKMRAGVAAGRALLAQGKNDEAQAAFDKVIAIGADDELAQEQRTLARLGKARTLLAAKKTDAATKIAEDILKAADPDDMPLLARAYNILGTADRQAGRTQEALWAFLHVEVLYASVPDAHAEALANLADLWEQVHKGERANRARKTLEEQYPDSPWAKKGGG